jgi:hypothetical protein
MFLPVCFWKLYFKCGENFEVKTIRFSLKIGPKYHEIFIDAQKSIYSKQLPFSLYFYLNDPGKT